MVTYSASALAAFIGVASATGWLNAPKQDCIGQPSKPAPVCSPDQAAGWSWQGLEFGIQTQFDGMSFTCEGGKSWEYSAGLAGTIGARDALLRGRTGRSGGCMGADLGSKPSWSCGGGRSFNAATFGLVSSIDAEIEIVFGQKNGGTCSQFASCSKHGTSVQNKQCGDATSVTFKHRYPQGKKPCSIGVSTVSYASCTSTTTFKSTPPSTPTPTPSSIPATTTASIPQTTNASGSTVASSTAASSSAVSSVPNSPPTTSETVTVPTTATVSTVATVSSVSTVLITTDVTVTSCASTVPNCPASSTVVSSSVITSYTTIPVTVPTTIATVTQVSTTTAPVVTTVYVTTSTTICPVTQTQITNNQTITSTFLTTSTIPVTITTTSVQTSAPVESTSVTPVTSAPASPSSSSPAVVPPPSSGGGCPNSVPSCLNSWLHLVPNCKDNTDAACFCAVANYTEQIIECLQAYSGVDTNDAISYFQGICAPYADKNPQPFTGVPSTITVTAPASISQTTVIITASGSTVSVTAPAVSISTAGPVAPGSPASASQAAPALVPVGQSSTIPLVGGQTPTGAAATNVATGTGALTVANPTTSGPAIATGAASRGFVSGGVGFAAVIVAVLAW